MKISFVHILIILAAVGITLLPGFILAHRVRTAEDYDVGGRHNGVGMVCAAIMGTIIGGAATMGTAQMGYQLGVTAWWFTLGCGIGMIIMAVFYAVPLRKSGKTTISEYLVLHFGKRAGLLASVSASAGMFFSVVASTLTAMNLCCSLFSVSPFVSACLVFLISCSFVFFGGLSGSGYTGVFKMLFIFCSIFAGACLCYSWMGGWRGVHDSFPAFPWFSLFGKGLGNGLTTFLAVVVGVLSTQTYAQAVFSARDSSAAVKGCLLAAALTVPVGIFGVLIGMFMRLHHPAINPIDALPMFLLTYLPPWLGGIGIAALILASLGGISGIALGIGTMFSRDIVHNIWAVTDNRRLLWAGRAGVMCTVLVAVVFVYFNMHSSVLGWNYLSMALRGSGICLPLTFCVLFGDRISPSYGLLSMGAGIAAALFWHFTGIFGLHPLIPALFVNLIFLLSGLVKGK